MARIRTIKPELFRHELLFEAEKETCLPLRLAFAALLTCADKAGRFQWRPRALKLDCLPYDDIDFSRVLDALVTRGFLVRYASVAGEYGCFPTWRRHQVINNKERESELPDPVDCEAVIPSENNNMPTRDERVNDATPTRDNLFQGEGKGREGNMEGKGRGTDMDASSSRPRSTRFVRPSLDEVRAYCAERKNHVDPQRFLDYYDANGWRVGKNPMRNWQAAIRTWEKNGGGNGTARTPEQAVADYDAKMRAKVEGARAMLERFNSIGQGQTIEGEVVK